MFGEVEDVSVAGWERLDSWLKGKVRMLIFKSVCEREREGWRSERASSVL